MLVLTRKSGESFFIGDGITVTVVQIDGNKVRIGIDAPKSVQISRDDIKSKTEKGSSK